MSRLKNGSIPSYRLHKARNCAVVTLDGRDHYLGPFGSPSSKQKYAGLIRVWQQRQEGPSPEPTLPLVVNDRPTINELILVYLRHVSTYYKSNHGENKEAGCVDDALKVLQECGYGREPADSFGGTLPAQSRCLYSYWKGYLKNPDWVSLQKQLAEVGGDFVPVHASGHIYIADLIEFVKAIAPRTVIPIHTFEPGAFCDHFGNVQLLNDGEPYRVS